MLNRKRLGDAAEEFVKPFVSSAGAMKVASLFKVPTPTARDKNGKIIYIAKSIADYTGFMLDGTGRHVAVEVKRCSEPSIPFDFVSEHQWEYLSAVRKAGGVAMVAVVHPRGITNDVLELDWSLFLAYKQQGLRKSVPLDDSRVRTVSPLSFLRAYLRPSPLSP